MQRNEKCIYYRTSLIGICQLDKRKYCEVKFSNKPKYTVSFDSDGAQTTPADKAVTPIVNPIKVGFNFVGWYNSDILFDFGIIKNKKLHWSSCQCNFFINCKIVTKQLIDVKMKHFVDKYFFYYIIKCEFILILIKINDNYRSKKKSRKRFLSLCCHCINIGLVLVINLEMMINN